MSADMFAVFEAVRAVFYAASVVMCLALAIEFGNLHDRHLAGVFATLSILYGILLMVVAVRYYGYTSSIVLRLLITPVSAANAVALGLLLYRMWQQAHPMKAR